jgi:REP element-mobilizing transposase RayT
MRSRFGRIRDGKVQLNALGRLVSKEWQRLAVARPNLKLDDFVVMPNHLHGLIRICEPQKRDSLLCSGAHAGAVTGQAGSLGSIIGQFKAAVSRRANAEGIAGDAKIWQRGYYDHIVRDLCSLHEIRRYILESPAKWFDDRLYVE